MTGSEPTPCAWEPLTPRGVAAFAHAAFARLWLVQVIVALLAAASVVWFLHSAWFPTVRAAIRRLPPKGEIRAGKLDWAGDSPQLLAEGPFLAFSVDLQHSGDLRSPAHVQVEFGQEDCFVHSLFGYAQFPYPPDRLMAFNRVELEPWWGAWEPELLGAAAGVVLVGLMLIWAALATCYFIPLRLAGFFANRDLTLGGSWRMAGAALMPGALVLTVAIWAYGFGGLDLVSLMFVAAAHIILGWIYAFASLLFLARHPAALKAVANPFQPDRKP